MPKQTRPESKEPRPTRRRPGLGPTTSTVDPKSKDRGLSLVARSTQRDPFLGILALLKEGLGVDLSQYKEPTIRRRIERRMSLTRFDRMSDYAKHLKGNPAALRELHDHVFIHVTHFFRDPESFQALERQVFPALLKDRSKGDPIRVWVPGCSTGEEVYSLAIALTEALDSAPGQPPLQIFGTDISEGAIQRARQALYTPQELSGIAPGRLGRFFIETPDGFRICKELRDLCVLAQHDLTRNPPFARLDLISCRNVLIYFGPELHKRIWPVFHYALKPGGYLWLGSSESRVPSPLFSTVDKQHKIYSKLQAARSPPRLLAQSFVPSPLSADPRRKAKRPQEAALPPSKARGSKKSSALESEVARLKESHRELLEQFETYQEELTSSNEELKATNEELLSTNEELQTAQAELQSANQELTTKNNELSARYAELISLNEKLARHEDRFRVMVDGVKDYAMYMLDPQGRVTSWNEGARRLKGYEASEILGQHYSRFFLPEDRERGIPQLEIERARIDGRFGSEGFRVRKDGSRFWANVVMTRMNDSKGQLIGFSKVTRDLTERRQAEQEIEAREKRFRLMISAVRDYAIFMLDSEGRVATWNEGARRLKGYEEKEIVGKHFSVFYPPADVAAGKCERVLHTAIHEGRVEDEGYRVRKDGTTFWANAVLTRLLDPQGNLVGFTKVTRDLTERKRAEEQLREANELLEHRVRQRTKELEQALRARDEFLSIASHELRTPLTSLKLQLQMARRNLAQSKEVVVDPDKAKSTFDKVLKQTAALEELVEDLLDTSRIQTGRFNLAVEDVSLSGLIEEVAARFSDQIAQAQTHLELDLAREVVGRWDKRRLTQVLVNLISNALKYAPGSPIRIATSEGAGLVKIVVEDFGPGISRENQTAVFERYERGGASPNVAGLGLGLFISRRIVEAHHGRIHLESEAGKGCRFIVELPLDAPGLELGNDRGGAVNAERSS